VPKLKLSQLGAEVDPDELEDAEWSEDGGYGDYDGEDPPGDIVLNGFIKKMWLSKTASEEEGNYKPTAGSNMFIILFEAAENVGAYEKYNGWSTWDYDVIHTITKFRWQPLMNALGMTIKYALSNLYVADEDEDRGTPILKIGNKFEVGEDSNTAYVCILTKREKRTDVDPPTWSTKVGKWLEWQDPEAPEEEEEEEEARPTRRSPSSSAKKSAGRTSRSSAPAEEEEQEQEEEEYDEGEEPEEPEEEEPPARRGRTSAAKPAAKATPAKAPTRTSRVRSGASSRTAAPRTSRGRAASGSKDDPPF
jgi:hypothetical protein